MEQIFGPKGDPNYTSQKILGIQFFDGDVDQAIDFIFQHGGFMVAPSGTCFARLRRDVAYRDAMIRADLAIPDSGAMVLLRKFPRGRKMTRISGLKYLQRLVARLLAENRGNVLWVLPTEAAQEKTARWLSASRFLFSNADLYVAPRYGSIVEDRQLLAKIENQKPAQVIIGIGSGPQEKLGRYLRDHLTYRPAIHCIGGALGFLTGDQVTIPDWADRFYLGWLFRLVAQPGVFVPRLARAFALPWLMWKYGEELPALRSGNAEN